MSPSVTASPNKGEGIEMYVGIDPSTKTGVVKLNDEGSIVSAQEIVSTKEGPARLLDLVICTTEQIRSGDIVCIEGFSYGSKGKAVDLQYGIGWALRMKLFEMAIPYIEVSPTQLKKYATGKGNSGKDAMILPIYRHWEFEHDSDNVRDAFVLAKIAHSLRYDSGKAAYQIAITEDLKKQIKSA